MLGFFLIRKATNSPRLLIMVKFKLSGHNRTEKKLLGWQEFCQVTFCQVMLLNCTVFLHDILVIRTRFVSWQRFQNRHKLLVKANDRMKNQSGLFPAVSLI